MPNIQRAPIQPVEDVQFGPRLAHLRKAHGLTQCDFAKAVGISQPFLSQLEKGKRDGNYLMAIALWRMANVLGVSMEYLLTGKERVKRRPARGTV